MTDKKVVPLDDHIPTLKEQRKRKANKRLIAYLSIFFFLTFIVVYFQSPLSHVRHIEVVGEQYTNEEEIIRESLIEKGTSIWSISKEEVIDNLLTLPEIGEVFVYRSLPSTIRIEVKEHERMAYVNNGSEYVPVLTNGTIITDVKEEQLPEAAPVLTGFTSVDVLKEFTAELSQVGEGIINRISEVQHQPTEEDPLALILYMNDGIQVSTTIRSFSERIAPYPSISREIDPNEPGILHMRINPYFESFRQQEEDLEEEED